MNLNQRVEIRENRTIRLSYLWVLRLIIIAAIIPTGTSATSVAGFMGGLVGLAIVYLIALRLLASEVQD